MRSPGRPRRSIEEAREFGRQVERAQVEHGGTLEAARLRVSRDDPARWGSRRTMMRLWAMYRDDQAKPPPELYDDPRLRGLATKVRQIQKQEDHIRGLLDRALVQYAPSRK